MAIKTLKIYNLDGKTPTEVPLATLPIAKASTEDGTSFTWKGIDAEPFADGKFPRLYQVDWEDEKNSNKARGFTHDYEAADKTFILSDLEPVGSFGISINGKMEIKDPKAPPADPPAAVISVRIGNMGKETYGQWVIDLSDTQDGNPPSHLNVSALISWVSAKASEDSEPEIDPEIKDKIKDFIINFEHFHFNITKKTFDIDVRSAAGSELTIKGFTLKEAGFQLTNEVRKKDKELPEPKKELE